jgi:heme/copper-type cytochrome/quinol oxidase subunit 4
MEIIEEKKTKTDIPEHIQKKLDLIDKITELSITKKIVSRKIEHSKLTKKVLGFLVVLMLALFPVALFIQNAIWVVPVFLITGIALFVQFKEYQKLSKEIDQANRLLSYEIGLIEQDIVEACSDECLSTSLDDKVRLFYGNLIQSVID